MRLRNPRQVSLRVAKREFDSHTLTVSCFLAFLFREVVHESPISPATAERWLITHNFSYLFFLSRATEKRCGTSWHWPFLHLLRSVNRLKAKSFPACQPSPKGQRLWLTCGKSLTWNPEDSRKIQRQSIQPLGGRFSANWRFLLGAPVGS